jgi:hypothetical protein
MMVKMPKLQLVAHGPTSMRASPSVQNFSDSASCGSTDAGISSADAPNDSGSDASRSRNSESAAACRNIMLDIISTFRDELIN